MKWIFLLFLSTSLIAADFSELEKPATVKILLTEQAKGALIEIKGSYHVFSPGDGVQLDSGILDKRAFLQGSKQGILWSDLFPGMFALRIVPDHPETRILVNGIQYRGCLEVYQIDSGIYIVNEVDMENYLKAHLTSQFSKAIASPVMQAIAIAARTNLHYQISKNKDAKWHLNDKDYMGSALIMQHLHVDRAVDETRHMILTYKKTPFATSWTKDSAGKTVSYGSVFRKEMLAPPGIVTPLAKAAREKHKWNFSLNKRELSQIASSINHIDLYVVPDSDKVYAVRINDSTLSFFDLQKIIGAERLKSNDFTVRLEKDQIIFTGYGEGEGVGLCLYSAALLAQQGEGTAKILASFYPGAELEHNR